MGQHYQLTDGVTTKYYFAGASRVAMRKAGTLYYLLSDHLGNTSLVTNSAGAIVSETRYSAWGETRYTSGTSLTNYKYTGQREESSFGLYFFNARWYDSSTGRFAQADSIVPGGVQGYDRYAYVNNNPVNGTDPTGHLTCMEGQIQSGGKCIDSGDGSGYGYGGDPGNGSKDNGGGGQTCQGISCLPPIPQSCTNFGTNCSFPPTMPIEPSDTQPNPASDAKELTDFWEYFGSLMATGMDMDKAYVLASSKWYKTAVYTLPTGPIEAGITSYRQYYKDSWWPKTYNPVQRFFRIGFVAIEALGVDIASSGAGDLAAIPGAVAGGPAGAAAAYGTTSYSTSKFGNDVSNSFNRWLFPNIGLGPY